MLSHPLVVAFLKLGLFKHPLFVALVQLGGGALAAYFLAERWQKWRQRRDFQFRTLVKFSELSEEAFNRLSELLVLADRRSPERRRALLREFVYLRGRLFAMDGEIRTVFKDDNIFSGLIYLRDIMRILYNIASRDADIRREEFEPIQDCMAAQRSLMISRMAREMRFYSRREYRQAMIHFGPRAQLPPGVTPPEASP